MEQFDVAIFGAGPTGLACGIELKKRGLAPVLFDKGCIVNSIYHYPINLVFFTTPDMPVRCAVEINQADREDPKIELRMGIHSGPVDRVSDVNERSNVAGAGINMAQRIMDCGDSGHILVSQRVAEDRLLRAPAELELRGDRRGELHDLVVEQRRPRLQAVGHGRDVDLREEVAGQVGAHVDLEQDVEDVVARRLLPGIADDLHRIDHNR